MSIRPGGVEETLISNISIEHVLLVELNSMRTKQLQEFRLKVFFLVMFCLIGNVPLN